MYNGPVSSPGYATKRKFRILFRFNARIVETRFGNGKWIVFGISIIICNENREHSCSARIWNFMTRFKTANCCRKALKLFALSLVVILFMTKVNIPVPIKYRTL
jgi:hypothetical protein